MPPVEAAEEDVEEEEELITIVPRFMISNRESIRHSFGGHLEEVGRTVAEEVEEGARNWKHIYSA